MVPIRIFLADDHAVIREGLKLLVNSQPDMTVVGEAGNGKEACRQARELQPDVVVMDISMPEMNGAQATERLRQLCPSVKVLALSAHEDATYLRQLLAMGASGYVLKRAVADELTRAIRTVAAGQTYLDSSMTSCLVGGFINAGGAGGEAELSDRETQVLRRLALGHTNKEIAGQIHVSIKSVETYKARLMEKLNLQTRAEIVRYALRQGWLKEE